MEQEHEVTHEFKKYLQDKDAKLLEWNDGNRDVLVTGMMRATGKTWTALKFVLPRLSTNQRLLYVVRTIGKTTGEKGTFDDSKKTIRKIEGKDELSRCRITMVAGKQKICSLLSDREENADGIDEEIKQRQQCFECEIRKPEPPEALKRKLENIDTLTPQKCSNLADQHHVCPTRIWKYHAEQVADVVFMTYAMLKQRGVVGNQYEFIIYDEARHLMQIDEVCNEELVTIQKSSEPDLMEWINGIESKYFPSIYGAENADVNWSAIEAAINRFNEFIYAKTGGEYVMDGWLKHDPEYLQKACQRERPRFYREEQEKKRVEDSLLNSDGDFEGNASVITLNKEKIEGMLFSLLRWYSSADGLPDDVDREMKKAIRCLNVLYKIAGSQRIELEVLEHPPSNEYSLHLRAFREKAIPRGNLTIYIDATPYPPQLYEHWLQLQPEELNNAHLQSNILVTIVVEDAKKTYPATYGHGDKSEGYKSHLRLLRGLKKRFEDKGLTVAVAARNKMVSQMLGSNEVEVDVVCGDVKAEGVQLDADVTIMEGVQIKNIAVDESQKFELARAWEEKGPRDRLWKLIHPNKIWRRTQLVENCQTMMQTAFRAIDREGKRANIIVILGHKMAHKPPGKMEVTGWTDLAKKWFTFLKEDCVRVVHINKDLLIKNKVEEIVQVANPHYDFSLTAFQNVLLDYLRTRPRGAKRKTIEDNISGSTEKIGDALRELVEKGRVERTKKGVYKYIPK